MCFEIDSTFFTEATLVDLWVDFTILLGNKVDDVAIRSLFNNMLGVSFDDDVAASLVPAHNFLGSVDCNIF